MAFNPFHWFRKRQKTFLAILAIFTMFIFVLQFGQGDAIQSILGAVGGRTKLDPTVVATLNGKKVTVGDLQLRREDRELANDFLLNAISRGIMAAEKEDREILQKVAEPYGKEVQDMLRDQFFRMRLPQFTTPEQAVSQILTHVQAIPRIRVALLTQNKSDAADALHRLGRSMEFELWRYTVRNESYFGLPMSLEGLLDFGLWRQQADKLGIVFTREDVRKAINEEAMTDILVGDSARDIAKLREFFGTQRYQYVTLDHLYTVLIEEFRVRAAQEAITGIQPGARGVHGRMILAGNESPSMQTPGQFWDAYKEQRTELRVALMTVPVQKYVSEVKGSPDETELRSLYNRYREIEPLPDRDKPAFKEPRRVKVEWVTATADAPFYSKKSAEVTQGFDQVRRFAGLGTTDTPLLPLSALTTVAVAQLDPVQMRLAAEYDIYTASARRWLEDDRQYDGTRASGAGSLALPENAVAVLGGMTGMTATQATPWAGLAMAQGATLHKQRQLSVRAITAVLGGNHETPLASLLQSTAVFTQPVKTQAEMKDQLLAQSSQRHITALVQGRLDEFSKELEGKGAKEAAEYIAKNAVPEQGITRREQMTEAQDRFAIETNPALAPLKIGHLQTSMFQRNQGPFGATFFGEGQLLYRPQPMRSMDQTYLWWKTEDRAAYVPTFDQARAKVEAKWRFDKARALARAEAEAVAAAIKNRKEGVSGERALRDEAVKRGFEVFEPTGTMARLLPTPSFRTGGLTQYEPFRFAESQIAFPRTDTVDTLLKNLQKPGETTLVTDRPEKHQYLAVLVSREEPTRERFYEVYERSHTGLFMQDMLWTQIERDRQSKYRADILKQLRADARAPLDADRFYVIDSDIRQKFDRRSDAEE